MTTFLLQPRLSNAIVTLKPLEESDFETLYAIASDPLVWEQHPNKNRYRREVFETFFRGAIESKGAFVVYSTETGEAMGSSRYYDFEPENNRIAIGYTFLGRKFWGGKFNPALKTIMLEYAFQYVNSVVFHVGAQNIRSQKAIERLGATKIAEQEIAYFGEPEKLNFVYEIKNIR